MAIVAVIMSVNFTACSDDDENDKQSNTVIGTWQVTSSTYTEEVGDTYTCLLYTSPSPRDRG